ncbi:MAG: acylphosphatase [Phycisphaerales bacterium]
MIRRAVNYAGRVQGVFFRATAKRCAEAHPVTGWVRNEPDGTVQLEIQGTPAAVEAALTDIRAAKSGNIERESAHDLPTVGGETGFEIRR